MKKFLIRTFITLLFLAIASNAYADGFTRITIDGISYKWYALLSSQQTGSNVYTDLQKAIDSGYSTVIVDTGSFNIPSTATLSRNGVTITGYSKEGSKLVMTNSGKDLLRVYANNAVIKNLTLDTKTYNAQAAFVVGDGNTTETTDETQKGNNITLSGCNVLGGNKIFTLFFAGPTYKSTIFTKYTANKLNDGNVITNNYFEGTYIRDAFVFALQKNGIIKDNTFVGGELDIYMNNGTSVTNNTSTNSNKSGIFLSGPSVNLTINSNDISNTAEHGIKAFYQIDNIPIAEQYKYINSSNIELNNISNVGETGIDLNYFSGGQVTQNIIKNSAVHGISLISNSSKNIIWLNQIDGFGQQFRFRGSGIFVTDKSVNNKIDGNSITTNKLQLEYAGIFIETPDSIGNIISNNLVSGSFQYAGLFSYTTNLTLTSNNITNYYGPVTLYK